MTAPSTAPPAPAWDPVWTPAVVVDLAHHGAWRQWAARQDGDQ